MAAERDDDTIRAGPPLVAFLLVAFVGLAFSAELIDAYSDAIRMDQSPWTLVVVDAVLLAGLFVLTLWIRRLAFELMGWWAVGALVTLALDVVVALWPPGRAWVQIAVSAVYIAALGAIVAATVCADPIGLATRQGRIDRRDEWRRLRLALPLLGGTFVAYAASTLWGDVLFETEVVRTLADAEVAASAAGFDVAGLPAADRLEVLDRFCAGAIDQEYFAQMSQIIPLLLIGVGIEANFFKALVKRAVGRAMIFVTVLILLVGEALAVSALPSSNQGCGDVLARRHEHAAFIVTLEAAAVGIVMLAWALVIGERERRAEEAER